MSGGYLFIDGAYLLHNFTSQMRTFYDVPPPQINFDSLRSSVSAGIPIHRAYFYDAIDYERHASESQDAYEARVAEAEALHSYIAERTGFHVRSGHVRRTPKKRNRQQKGVDVLLAVDALEHAARGNMDAAILLTGDLDFEPLLDTLVRFGVHTRLVYAPRTTSAELKQAADEIMKVTLEHFHAWSPQSFRDNHKTIKLDHHEQRPERPIFEVAREGAWQGRKVELFKPINQSNPRLYVEPGNELSKPSYTIEYHNIDKLPLAFELTFGPVTWT